MDKKQWKIGIRQANDRHCAREDDSHLRKKNHKQTKFSIRTGWVTIIPCRKTYKSQYKKAKAEKNQEPKSPYIDVDP